MGDSKGFVRTLRTYFVTYGVPGEIATNGATVFMSAMVKDLLASYQVEHRVSSAHFPHPKQKAELGVKSMKRLCRENVGRNGSLDSDNIVRGLLAYRNTPDMDTNRSPAEVLYGRQLCGDLPVVGGRLRACDRWRLLREDRKKALSKRALRNSERLDAGSRQLPRLALGSTVRLRNLSGPFQVALNWGGG